jgi:flagellin FlaB
MKGSAKKFHKNDAAFTGLEAAIVLIAFVVVAAVFSYVMLGAGFFTSQKSKEVVHTGVDQATSSIELTGDVIGVGDTSAQTLSGLKFTLELTAGNNPVDLNKTIISYRTTTVYNNSVFFGEEDGQITWVYPTSHTGNLLKQFEKAQININFDSAEQVGVNTKIQLSVAPSSGAVLPISVTTPPTIDAYMVLV